jgi:hypothetical protein
VLSAYATDPGACRSRPGTRSSTSSTTIPAGWSP